MPTVDDPLDAGLKRLNRALMLPSIAVCSRLLLGDTSWYKGLEYVDAGTVAVFFLAKPVVGALLAAAFLGEALGPAFLSDGAVMAGGRLPRQHRAESMITCEQLRCKFLTGDSIQRDEWYANTTR